MEELIYPRCYHPKDLWKQIEIINQFIPVETNENFIKNAMEACLPDGAEALFVIPKLRSNYTRATSEALKIIEEKRRFHCHVDHINFEVKKGEIFGFLGPNGAGKSTTINMLSTILPVTDGEALINDFSILSQRDDVRKSIGLVFQDPSLDDRLTAEENLRFHAKLYGVPSDEFQKRKQEVLELVDLWDRQNDIVKNFSGGMKRRLEIARGLLHYPAVLFLDEPTIGLDPQTRAHLWDYILRLKREKEMTIFMTTHYMNEAEYCDHIAIIDQGKIVALGTPRELKKQIGGDIISMTSNQKAELKKEIEKRYNYNSCSIWSEASW
jgi:ABC-2 type transport system ATP-binding protein